MPAARRRLSRRGAALACAALAALALCAVVAGPAGAARVAFRPDDAGSAGRPGGWSRTQWNFTGPYGVNAPAAWANLIAAGRPGGAGVTVAVLDSGVAYSNRPPFHRSPDLAHTRFVPGYDFVDDDPYPVDGDGHGTHVASTIAEQTDNGVGLTGLAYGVRIMPVRVLGGYGEAYGDADVVARGIRFATAHGADVINLSLSFDNTVGPQRIPGVLDAIDDAYAHGVLVVAASGNRAAKTVAYPARTEHALAVGATTEHGCVSSYSDVGAGLDIVAPGGGDDRAQAGDPHCRAGRAGRPIAQVTLDAPRSARFGIRDYVGTSMAVPHVAAAAALVAASGVLGPKPSPAAIADRLEHTARDLGAAGYDEDYGWGLLDAAAATQPAAQAAAQPRASAAGGDVVTLTYPSLVTNPAASTRRALKRAVRQVQDGQAAAAVASLTTVRRQLAAAWRGAAYVIRTTPPPPATQDSVQPGPRARASGGAPAGPTKASPADTAFLVLTLQHTVAAAMIQLTDDVSGAGLSPVATTLTAALDARDQALKEIRRLAPPPAPSEAGVPVVPHPRARAAGGAPVATTFDTVMPDAVGQLDDELQAIDGLRTDSTDLAADGRRLLATASSRVLRTKGTVNRTWPPVPVED